MHKRRSSINSSFVFYINIDYIAWIYCFLFKSIIWLKRTSNRGDDSLQSRHWAVPNEPNGYFQHLANNDTNPSFKHPCFIHPLRSICKNIRSKNGVKWSNRPRNCFTQNPVRIFLLHPVYFFSDETDSGSIFNTKLPFRHPFGRPGGDPMNSFSVSGLLTQGCFPCYVIAVF